MQLGAIFLVALSVTCLLLSRVLPFPDVPLVRDKIEFLRRHGDEYDVLFLGSSRVHCQVIPGIFDRIARENGVPVKSFNAGINAMISPENDYVLQQILRLPHRRLRWVIIELSRLGTGLSREETARFGYWHDSQRLSLIVRRLCGQALESQARLGGNLTQTFGDRWNIWSETGELIYRHTCYALRRAVNLGRGAEMVDDWLRDPHAQYQPAKSLGRNLDGWLSMDRIHKEMTGDLLASYNRSCAERLAQPSDKERGDPVSQEALEQLLADVTKSGATPLLFVPPTPADRHFYPTAGREQELTILDFSDVQAYATLFAPENRLDIDHLNDAGAEVFSEDLGRRFAEIVKAGARKP